MIAAELIKRGAVHHRNRVAAIFGSAQWTYGEVNANANRLAHAVFDIGLRKGDRVAILLSNSIHSLEVDFALIKSGLVRVPINTRLATPEMARMIQETDAKLVLFSHEFLEKVEEMPLGDSVLKAMIGSAKPKNADIIDLDQIIPTMSIDEPEVEIHESDLVTLQYTSGTTGVLKAAMHTQETWAAIALNILTNVPVQSDDIMLHTAPLTHAAGTLVLPHWIRGAANAILPGFRPQEFLQAVSTLKPSTLNLVPTMIVMLLSQPNVRDYSFDSVRSIIYGAAPIPTETLRQGIALWGPKFVQYYGQTESPLILTVLAANDHDLTSDQGQQHLLSSGRVVPTARLKIVDEDNDTLKVGEIGEIAVQSSQNMVGYWQETELTAATMLPGGWIKTRDLGYLDDDGYVYLVDRKSDMIITGGFNVYPREIEDVLYRHPAILEAAAIGVPDEIWGESIKAFVVLREGAAVTEDEIIDWCREQLAGYKRPKSVEFVVSLPKSPVDKVLRRVLREPYWENRPRKI